MFSFKSNLSKTDSLNTLSNILYARFLCIFVFFNTPKYASAINCGNHFYLIKRAPNEYTNGILGI